LKGGNSPWVVKDIQGLLVVDIVCDVEKVPKSKVDADLESFPEASFLGFFGLDLSSSS
jgi:hypothetical protein